MALLVDPAESHEAKGDSHENVSQDLEGSWGDEVEAADGDVRCRDCEKSREHIPPIVRFECGGGSKDILNCSSNNHSNDIHLEHERTIEIHSIERHIKEKPSNTSSNKKIESGLVLYCLHQLMKVE